MLKITRVRERVNPAQKKLGGGCARAAAAAARSADGELDPSGRIENLSRSALWTRGCAHSPEQNRADRTLQPLNSPVSATTHRLVTSWPRRAAIQKHARALSRMLTLGTRNRSSSSIYLRSVSGFHLEDDWQNWDEQQQQPVCCLF